MPSCGLDAEGDVILHWTPSLDGHKERHQESGTVRWRADCPRCRADRSFWYWPAGRYIRYRSYCPCEKPDLQRCLFELLPGCIEARYRGRHRIEADELIAILLDKSLPPNALRVACLQELGMSTADIRAKLGLAKQSWSDVVRVLGRNRGQH